jgi:hypothetical protein
MKSNSIKYIKKYLIVTFQFNSIEQMKLTEDGQEACQYFNINPNAIIPRQLSNFIEP